MPTTAPITSSRPLMLACLAGLSLAQHAAALPPPTVFFRQGQTFFDGVSTLTYEYHDNYTIDDSDRVFISARAIPQGSGSSSDRVFAVYDHGVTTFLGSEVTLGAALDPPQARVDTFSDISFARNGSFLATASANNGYSTLLKTPTGPFSLVTEAGTLTPGALLVLSPGYISCAGPWATVSQTSVAPYNMWIFDHTATPRVFTSVYAAGTQVPDLPAGITMTGQANMQRVNRMGRFVYSARGAGPGVTANVNDQVIVTGDSTTSVLVARRGSPAPGIAGATYGALPTGLQYEYLFLADSGELAFSAQTTAGRAIFAGAPGSIAPVVTAGLDTLAGVPGRVLDLIFDQSPSGQRVIWAGMNSAGATSGTNKTVLFRGTGASPQVIAQSGQTAPGLPLGTTFVHIERDFVVNDAGWVVFRAGFTASTQYPSGGFALFGWTGSGGPALIMVPGETVQLDGGQTTTIQTIHALRTGNRASSLTPDGMLVVDVFLADETVALVGRNIQIPPPPVPFSLQNPIANAISVSQQPTLAWTSASTADSYTVSITPDGGTTSTFETTSTSFSVPSGLLQPCQGVTWSVVASNQGGLTASTPVSQRFTTFSLNCVRPPVYTIERIGLQGGIYRSTLATLVTPEGRVAGYSDRYAANTQVGKDAWIWDGQTSAPLSLTGPVYETGGLSVLKRDSTILALNTNGKAIGSNIRYASGGTVLVGSDAWLYDGQTVQLIGLTGAGYDQTPGSATTRRNNFVVAINPADTVIGYTVRYSPTGTNLGFDVWSHRNGVSTVLPSLSGADYQYTTAAGVYYYNTSVAINASSHIIGYTDRVTSTGSSLGADSWLYQGSTLTTIAVTGPEFEFPVGSQIWRTTRVVGMNDQGAVVGTANRRSSTGATLGASAFIWNSGAFTFIDPVDTVHSFSSAAGITRTPLVRKISPQGFVAGQSARYSATGASLGTDIWCFDGVQTHVIGLVGPEYQTPAAAPNTEARRENVFVGMNANGLVFGRTQSFPSNQWFGWVFDPTTGTTTPLTVAGVPTAIDIDQYALTDSGAVLSRAMLPTGVGSATSHQSSIWSPQTGIQSLESRVLGGLPPEGWQVLVAAIGGAGEAPYAWPRIIAGYGIFPTAVGQSAFVLQAVDPPGGFNLLDPPEGGSLSPLDASAEWSAADSAISYTIALTPEGATPVSFDVVGTSLTIPPGLAENCRRFTWSVFANSASGSTISTPPTRTFSILASDFNRNGSTTVQDVFDFLSAYFTSDPRADFNASGGITVQDVFDFLTAYFTPC
ncbi:MAG: hypothetical protein IT438_14195 [Phycisphaerales bacterium]|nr:hypothetical protein [Phycisphaerales bacterium]